MRTKRFIGPREVLQMYCTRNLFQIPYGETALFRRFLFQLIWVVPVQSTLVEMKVPIVFCCRVVAVPNVPIAASSVSLSVFQSFVNKQAIQSHILLVTMSEGTLAMARLNKEFLRPKAYRFRRSALPWTNQRYATIKIWIKFASK
jgi:hypothetical protein